MPDRVLEAMAVLERRYNGPIPEPAKRAVVYGTLTRWLLIEAVAQAEFFSALVRGQLWAIRQTNGAVPANLYIDLALYRRCRYRWRREIIRLSAADAP